jgi:hypothetical protein
MAAFNAQIAGPFDQATAAAIIVNVLTDAFDDAFAPPPEDRPLVSHRIIKAVWNHAPKDWDPLAADPNPPLQAWAAAAREDVQAWWDRLSSSPA